MPKFLSIEDVLESQINGQRVVLLLRVLPPILGVRPQVAGSNAAQFLDPIANVHAGSESLAKRGGAGQQGAEPVWQR